MLQLQLEVNSVCNAACRFCIYPTSERKRGFMKESLFYKIIDEAASIPLFNHVTFAGLSETLLDPHLVSRVAYVKRKMPHAYVDLYTNGSYLSPHYFDSLRDAGLTALIVSLNGGTAEDRKRMMGLDDWERVIGYAAYAINNRGHMGLEFRAVVNEDSFTMGHAGRLVDMFGDANSGGFIRLIKEGNWSGDKRTVKTFKPNELCTRATEQIYVTWEGIVTTCCQDPLGKMRFGDLNTQTLREIYNSEPYVKFREAHAENRADEYDICKKCSRT